MCLVSNKNEKRIGKSNLKSNTVYFLTINNCERNTILSKVCLKYVLINSRKRETIQ